MIALDTDVLTLYLHGDPIIVGKIQATPREQIVLPLIVVEEVVRGRLNLVRQAQAGKSRFTLSQAYELFAYTFLACQYFTIFNYSEVADQQFEQWSKMKIKVGTRDLRIGAICVTEKIQLATRNIRDFNLIHHLNLETWN